MTGEQIYNAPKYYEQAFNFVDVPKQIDLFELIVKKYGRKETKSVIDIGCGPSLQLPEFARRRYFVAGLDQNQKMINYLDDKLTLQKAKFDLYRANMKSFRVGKKYDLAFILMGSIHYLKSHSQYFNHLNSMANILKKGGLYLIENLPICDRPEPCNWTSKDNDVVIETDYIVVVLNQIQQTAEHNFHMKIYKNGKKEVLKQQFVSIYFSPQEFKLLIEQHGKFELIGFFQRNNPLLLELTCRNPENMLILKRK